MKPPSLVPRPSESEEGLVNIVHHHMVALVLKAKPLKLLAGLQYIESVHITCYLGNI